MSKLIVNSFAAVGLVVGMIAAKAEAAPLNANNLVVVSVGDTKAPGGTGNLLPVELKELTTAGSPVQSIALPIADAGSNNALTINRLRNNGGLNLSEDKQYLLLGGTDAAPRTTPVGAVGRTIGRIDAGGNVDTGTRFDDAYDGVTEAGIRTVASVDGSAFWVSGDGTSNIGVRYIPFGDAGTTAITDTASRHLTIFQSQLYNSNGGATAVGTGLPTSGPVVSTQLPGLPFGPQNSPVFFDLNPVIGGPDVLYLGNEDGPALLKYTFDGTIWSLANSFSTDTVTGLLFLTGRVESGNVVIYATTRSAGNPSFGNSIVRLEDVGPASTFSVLTTADETHGFRGIAFGPDLIVPEPSTYALIAMGLLGMVLFRRKDRRSR